ncbi:RNA polymerase sigma-54 factor [Dolosicoccus paucivorans]|uniref:RNA polymerase sigma-54 factor n=1 Tax=Dolosicoccus paucivorans TaxID=84521 RepID=A0A2N6SLD2_9LACT|nr:RNA polymerase factor sigma-54 [Dolosicoccus paucivorans]PMC57897.1 RNA polymerase sigma-54 factor [Dolosicoccus paucivorans]
MKHQFSQHLNQSQQVTLTPELQQAVQLLQYNFIDLKDFLYQKATENPFLKVENMDYFFEHSSRLSDENSPATQWIEQIPSKKESSLRSYLYDQIVTTYRKTPIRDLMIQMIDEIDPNGYLISTNEQLEEWQQLEHYRFLDALTLIQQLDPPGVGARSLKECLLLQIERDDDAPPLAHEVVEQHFECLFREPNDQCDRWKEVTPQLITYIQSLTPRPGLAYGENTAEYLYPEIMIHSSKNQISYELNRTMMPRISFDQELFQSYQQQKDDELTAFLKTMKKEFDWLKTSLTAREETLTKLAEAMIYFQKDYLLNQSTVPVALTMKQAAQWMDVHESTVSRLVKNKYIDWNGQTVPLRHFFPTPIAKDSDTTKEMVQHALTELIDHESKDTPYSDQTLSELLKEKGLSVARRTVAKYRQELNIPSATQRKLKLP